MLMTSRYHLEQYLQKFIPFGTLAETNQKYSLFGWFKSEISSEEIPEKTSGIFQKKNVTKRTVTSNEF